MTPENYGQPATPPGIWPPPPTNQTGVWPPAPQSPALMVPFKYVPRRASSKEVSKARLSDFREGMLQIGADGIVINGKAVLRAEIRYPIFILAILIARFIGIVAYAVMEYGFRRDATLQVPWNAVRLVQLAPQKNQACMVFDAPNYKGIVKTFTLAFILDPAYFAAFAQQVQQAVPGRLTEGSLRNVTSWRVWLRLIVLLIVIVLAVFAAVGHHH